jgi:hypothetical protein
LCGDACDLQALRQLGGAARIASGFLAHAESVSCVSQSLPLPAVQARGTMGRLMARWPVRAFLRPAAPPIPLSQEISE